MSTDKAFAELQAVTEGAPESSRSLRTGALLTSQPGLWHVVSFVVHPLWSVRPDVGLGGSVSYRVIADPSGQVDVESARINDAICVHQTLFSQLQKKREEQRSFRAGCGGKHTAAGRARLCTHIPDKQNTHASTVPQSHKNTFDVFQNTLIGGCSHQCVYSKHTVPQMAQELAEPIKSEC